MAEKHKVVVFRTNSCPWCHKTVEFLKEHKISFKEIDVGNNIKAAREMVEKSGQMGVPVIEIDGKIIIVGYDERALRKYLHIAS